MIAAALLRKQNANAQRAQPAPGLRRLPLVEFTIHFTLAAHTRYTLSRIAKQLIGFGEFFGIFLYL
ncbi:MAG: hypothetical protein A3K04_00075 [Gallionellales bacterium RBG_16_56_9]|nr:MAG: hypothetical protein A3K04_00075 [Gallionellales bacterium RBG_16_56_9]